MGVAVGVWGGEFGGVGDQREGGQEVGELRLGQAVEVGDQAVQFGAEFRALGSKITAYSAMIPPSNSRVIEINRPDAGS